MKVEIFRHVSSVCPVRSWIEMWISPYWRSNPWTTTSNPSPILQDELVLIMRPDDPLAAAGFAED